MLDIGCGNGIYSLYALERGASYIVGLEPLLAGSDNIKAGIANKLAIEFGAHSGVNFLQNTLHDYISDMHEQVFDIVLLHNSVNHLDELNVAKLEKDTKARDLYRHLFCGLYDLVKPRGVLIITDCSRHNFWKYIGLKNPFAGSIEWGKHQSPYLWALILEEANFRSPYITWGGPMRLKGFGRVLFGNRIAAYFYNSFFRLAVWR